MIGKFCIWLINGYKKFISPLQRGKNCRFEPTCSAYAIEAVQVHGAAKGLVLAAWRVLRCNPFCKRGFDPVPQQNKWRAENRNLFR